MATEFYFYCYPWDLEDEGIDIALTRLLGELRVEGVNVAAAYPGVTAFRPRQTYSPRTVRFSAGVAFQPDASRYASTHLRPITGGWIKSRNPLAKMVESAERHGLKLRLTVECCDNPPLAEKYPMVAGVNVFGEPMPDRLCPSHPDVQAYLAALIDDLSAHYRPHAIELRSADFGPGFCQCEDAAPIFERARYCLSLCFCASCRRAATESGVDGDDAAEQARNVIDESDAARDQWTVENLLNENRALAAYDQVRRQTVADLCAAIKRNARTSGIIAPIHDDPFRGQDAKVLSGILDGQVCQHSVAGPGDATVQSDTDVVLEPARRHVRVHASRRMFRDGQHLFREVGRIVEQKVASIGFANYGLLPEPCLDWVPQAIRFAKREVAR